VGRCSICFNARLAPAILISLLARGLRRCFAPDPARFLGIPHMAWTQSDLDRARFGDQKGREKRVSYQSGSASTYHSLDEMLRKCAT
jgi:hypothetical protein